jgi:hypothetical protein
VKKSFMKSDQRESCHKFDGWYDADVPFHYILLGMTTNGYLTLIWEINAGNHFLLEMIKVKISTTLMENNLYLNIKNLLKLQSEFLF